MTSHRSYLELAAAGIDFPLSPAEHTRLERHLRGCAACARSAAALRLDAERIAQSPVPRLPERRGDEILRAAIRPDSLDGTVRMLIALALLGLLLVGGLIAGAQLLHTVPNPLLPPPMALETPGASPTDAAVPSGRPAPNLDPVLDAPLPPAGQLAFTWTNGSGQSFVETVDIATGTVSQVGEGSDPAWMGRGQVAYTCTMPGNAGGVCFVNSGDEPSGAAAPDADRPAPAPGFGRVAVHRGTIDVGETWTLLPNGNDLVKIAAGSFLRWSPDGSMLVGQPEGAQAQVAVVGADGTGLRVLATGYAPAWSPDGTEVAFAVVDAQGSSLQVADVASGSARTLYAVAAPSVITGPVWLEGGRIAFVLDGNLWRYDPGFDRPVQLTTGLQIVADDAHGWPVLSPEGAHIAFTTGTGSDARVGVASVWGRGSALLDALPDGAVRQPAWAPGPSTIGTATGQLGDAWTEGSLPVTPGRPVDIIDAVAPNGSGFVAVGRGCTEAANHDITGCEGVVLLSGDGRSWERAPRQDATDIGAYFPTSGPSVGMLDVAVGTPGIVVVGYAARPDMLPTSWFSPDGATWTRTALDTSLLRRVNAVTWDGTRFVAVGQDRDEATSAAAIGTAHGRAAVWTSTDGRTWTRVQDPALAAGGLVDTMEDPGSGGMADVAVGTTGLVGVGSTCVVGGKTFEAPWTAPCTAAIWRSSDGAAWERVELPLADLSVLGSVVGTATGYVAVGPSTILLSQDGRAWMGTQSPALDLVSVTLVGGRLFLTSTQAGQDGAATRLWVSADGITWNRGTVQGGIAPTEPSTEAQLWRFAANGSTAVWLARTDTAGINGWYSTAGR